MAQSFENVRLVIADQSPIVRAGLRGALFSIGFRTINETASFIKLHALIEQDAIDLLIVSSELEGNDTGYLVSEMRNQRLGPNPFMVVISLLAQAEPEYVRRVIDSGADDLLVTPVQPDQLILRIEKLSRARKPFVITHDYTGPDRRTKARAADGQSAPMLEVPNPLKVRAETNGLDGTRLNRMVANMGVTLNRLKIERYAVQIDWLVNHIHASIRDGVSAEASGLAGHTSRLSVVAEDMARRLKDTPAEGVIPPVAELLAAARRLEIDAASLAFAEIEHLTTLSRAISRALGAPPAALCSPAPMPAARVG